MPSHSVTEPVLCLASASPRRRELLTQIGVKHIVRAANIDETERPCESAADYVVRMAREKALDIWHKDRSLPVLAADTTVVVDGVIFGKPRNREHGLHMLTALSNRAHEVLTCVVLAHAGGLAMKLSASTVRFRATSAQERAVYWESNEPCDKAGGYAIQGLGAVFIESLSGSYSGVMGLPLFETAELLREAGLRHGCSVPS